MTDLGCAAVVAASLVEDNEPVEAADYADGELRMAVTANRLRTDAFAFCIFRSLTFEVSWHQRRGALDCERQRGRRPSACWPVRHVVGVQRERRARRHLIAERSSVSSAPVAMHSGYCPCGFAGNEARPPVLKDIVSVPV